MRAVAAGLLSLWATVVAGARRTWRWGIGVGRRYGAAAVDGLRRGLEQFRPGERLRLGERLRSLQARFAGGDRRFPSRWALYIAVTLALAVLAGGLGYNLTLSPVAPGSSATSVVLVAAGQGTSQIASNLAAEGLIRSAAMFRVWTRLTGTTGRLQAGEYSLGPYMSTPQIAARLARGQVVVHPLTVPEGYNLRQIEALLVERGFTTAEGFRAALAGILELGLVPAAHLPERSVEVLRPLEGYLFADTYHLPRGIGADEIVTAMVNRYRSAFAPDFEVQAGELGMTVAEVMTLASIIEKEAVVAEERAIISGVFHNRLRRGMRLESCATLRYVMPDPDGPIRAQEMAIDSVYNTYAYAGLPPGPICSPGLASIEAALYPAETDYLFFVAKLDGTHAFSRTFAEHQRNIRRYLR